MAVTSRHLENVACTLVLALATTTVARAQECEDGRERVEGRCCWPGQAWAAETRRCQGIPLCPGSLVESGEDCVASAASVPRDARGRPSMGPASPSTESTAGWSTADGDPDAPAAWPVASRGEDSGLVTAAFVVLDIGYLLGWLGVWLDEAGGGGCNRSSGGGFPSSGRQSCNTWQYAGMPVVGGLLSGTLNQSDGDRTTSFGPGFGIPSIIIELIAFVIMMPVAFANSTHMTILHPIHITEGTSASLELSAPGTDGGASIRVTF